MKRSSQRDFLECQDGSALLEFALVLPILMTLCFGCVEIGRVLFTYSVAETAVASGARFLAQVPDPTCVPTCSWGAARAIELTREQIVSNTGIRSSSVRVTPRPDDSSGVIVLDAEVDISIIFPAFLGQIDFWTVRVSRQEQKIAG